MITELERLLDIKVDVVESGAGTARFQATVLAEAVPL
jgi:predicted nucleotidyltransferase